MTERFLAEVTGRGDGVGINVNYNKIIKKGFKKQAKCRKESLEIKLQIILVIKFKQWQTETWVDGSVQQESGKGDRSVSNKPEPKMEV